jgi:bifunctional DNA primase/polymerase-like protein
MTLLETALSYARAGYRVFPVNGKQPAIKRFYLAHATEYQIRKWWTKHPHRNIGIAPRADLVVFDPDNQEGLEFLARVLGLTPDELLQSTRSVRTPGGGHHLYYTTTVVYKNHTAKKILDEQGNPLAIDIKT